MITALGRVGFPVVRYRTGDMIERNSAACSAGHAGMWLPQGILGRVDDMVVIRGMNVFPSAIEEILRRSSGVGEFSITFYNDPRAMDEVKVEVELAQPREAREIQARLRQTLGLRVRIVPVKPGILPTYSGKARRVQDLRPVARAGREPWRGDRVRRSASEEVADAIRAYMFGRGLEPGDRLGREEDLAQRFGVSRPTLREALRLLSSAHLIRATKGPGGGIFVAATAEQGIGLSVSESVASMLSADTIDIDELIETRMLLEIPLAGLAAQRATEEDVAGCTQSSTRPARRAGRLVPRARHAPARDDRRDRRQPARARVHRVDRQVLQPPLQLLVEPAVVDAVVVEQHRDIVRAIERGDPKAAERAMREHLVYLHDLVGAVAPRGGGAVSAVRARCSPRRGCARRCPRAPGCRRCSRPRRRSRRRRPTRA